MKTERLEIAVTPTLSSRLRAQIAWTGENKSEFTRRCILEKLDALEAKQIDELLIQQAMGGSISA